MWEGRGEEGTSEIVSIINGGVRRFEGNYEYKFYVLLEPFSIDRNWTGCILYIAGSKKRVPPLHNSGIFPRDPYPL